MKADLQAYIAQARWFGGKGREFEVVGARRLALAAADAAGSPRVDIELVSLAYRDGGEDVYQVPTSTYGEPQAALSHALIGSWHDEDGTEVWVYDALHDHAATPAWLHGFAEGSTHGPLTFHRIGSPDLEVDARSTLMSGEQSNSSVVFGDGCLMKVFRRVTPGINPDIEILSVLTEAGDEHVAPLYGWVGLAGEDGPDGPGDPLQLGILQQFLRTASDGWDLALASLRSFFAEDDVEARDSGGDFAAESHRLGVAVAKMHSHLAEGFPTETWGADRLGTLAEAMAGRLEEARAVVPELEPHVPGLTALFEAVRDLDHPVRATRVHGDLHLGQTLRTVVNWKIIDFEGEPSKSLEERRRPDSPWRDVAGMLRSFDYAAEITRLGREEGTADPAAADRAHAWADRNRDAFLRGYRETTGAPLDTVLIAAYTADKAVYEAVYEARNRPSWLSIPLAAIDRLAAASPAAPPL